MERRESKVLQNVDDVVVADDEGRTNDKEVVDKTEMDEREGNDADSVIGGNMMTALQT